MAIFISHASEDDALVARLRERLENRGLPVWSDSRRLRGGDGLKPEIEKAIREAPAVLAVLSVAAFNSSWVQREVRFAQETAKKNGGLPQVIPLLVPPLQPSSLGLLFEEEPLALLLATDPNAIDLLLPDLLAALGEVAPDEAEPTAERVERPLADLVLELSEPTMVEDGGKRRARAEARLVFTPPDGTPEVKGRRFGLTAPLGPLEVGELDWYLEDWPRWPNEELRFRAERVETALPEWGRLLWGTLGGEAARAPREAWLAAAGRGWARRFTVEVEPAEPGGEQPAQAAEAATQLLAVPWELLDDGQGPFLHGKDPVRVRRRQPNTQARQVLPSEPPIRILLVSPRPEDERAGFIDHRMSARPLVEALVPLGSLVALDVLVPPTFEAMVGAIRRAAESGRPYHVVHFDGHGVYDRKHGLGALCFENPADHEKLHGRRTDIVHADRIAQALRDHRVPVVFLEACQGAKADDRPDASVAAQLLDHGVASVVAMTHSVLVETARRFVAAFYRELMDGASVDSAVLAGQQALDLDRFRLHTFSGDLELRDWFVPVLFQEKGDPRLVAKVPPKLVQAELVVDRRAALHDLPEPPPHRFVGRSRELLSLERLLVHRRWAVVLGEGGEGKTTLACELAHWLVETNRAGQAAFVSLERDTNPAAVLAAMGRQLVPDFMSELGRDEEQALRLLDRAFGNKLTVLVVDNAETVLAPPAGSPEAEVHDPEALAGILELLERWSRAGETRLLITSREALPPPFDADSGTVRIGRLDRNAAIELVGRVLGKGGMAPAKGDEGEVDIATLVDAVGGHARALVLLAREIAASGVAATTADLRELMQKIHGRQQGQVDDERALRERSLFASVELSLRRLPSATRVRIAPLAVFHGGGHLHTIGTVLGLDMAKAEEAVELAGQLVAVGLAQATGDGYFHFDPALAPYLAGELTAEEEAEARSRWAKASRELIEFLYWQFVQGATSALRLASRALPNLLACLYHLKNAAEPAVVIETADGLEKLVSSLGRGRVVEQVAQVREAVAARLSGWSHARHLAESAGIDRLLDAGRFSEAIARSQALVEGLDSTTDAFPAADYDRAEARFRLGRALHLASRSDAALVSIEDSRRRFEVLSGAGDRSAEGMVLVVLTETVACLRALGRLDDAAARCGSAIEQARIQHNQRQVAVGHGQLGAVRLLQRRFSEALSAYEIARRMFEALNEPHQVAVAWHQIGIVLQEIGHHAAAEGAHQQSLTIKTRLGDRTGEARSLNELGYLYGAMGRFEDAAHFHDRSARCYVALGNLSGEGIARNNLADALATLGRIEEARREILRAIECKSHGDHSAEPWASFYILYELEQAGGNTEAAQAARRHAIEAYRAYRRDGGESQLQGAHLCATVALAIRNGTTAQIRAELAALRQELDLPAGLIPLLSALDLILAGSRDHTLAEDRSLDCDGAAELGLLLEQLDSRYTPAPP